MFVGSALDGAKGINNLARGNYTEAIINGASIEGGIIFGDLGEVVGNALGGGFPNPLSLGLGSVFAGLGAAGGSRLFTAVAQTALGYTNGRAPGETGSASITPGSNGFFSAGLIDLGSVSPQFDPSSISLTPPLGAGFTQPNLDWAYPASDLAPFNPDVLPGLNFPLPTYELPLPDLSFTEIPDPSFPQFDLGLFFPDLGDYGDFGDFDFGPVILNLDGKGLNLDTLSSSTQFVDTDGSGYEHRTAWAAKGNGVLALDLYGDGKIHQKNQYAFTEWDPTATSDLQALKDVFDTNHNGKIDAGDASWSQFKVMVSGQMVSLDSLGITSIDLTPTGSGQTFADGSAFTGTTSYTKSDGTEGQVGDAVLATDSRDYLIHQTQTTNAGGSVTTDIVGSNADGSKAFENVSTLSADGLSKTISYDDNGDGIFDRSQSIVTVANADGSSTKTTRDFNADGSLKDRTTISTSADTKTVTTLVDQNGDGVWDQSQLFVGNADGLTSTTTKNLAASGATINQTQVLTSTDGLTKTTKVDNAGSGTFDQVKTDTTVVNADGSRLETVTDAGSNGAVLDQTVTSTSADARSKTVSVDHTGSGSSDLVTTSSITVNADQSVTTAVQDKNADGSLRDSSTTTLSADGRSKTVSNDLNGDGSIDQVSSDITIVASHGVRTETISRKSGNGTLLGQTVITSSADMKSITTTVDANGDGAVDAWTAILVDENGATTTTKQSMAPNGVLVQRTETTASADGLTTTTKLDSNGDGTYDLVTTDTVVANADGSRTETVADTSANGTLIGKTISTRSANGLTQSKSQDLNGDGTADQTTTDAVVLNSDGSRTEAVSVVSGTGALLSKTTTTTSADRKTTTKLIDSNGDGHVDETQLSVLGSDGSTTRTVTDTSANGSMEAKSVSTTSANGLSTTTQTDVSGDGAFEGSTTDVTVLNADGSKTQTQSRLSGNGALLSRSVVNTSGNGLTITTQADINGDGIFDGKTTDSVTLNADGSKTETVSDYNGDGTKLIDRTITLTSASGLSKTVSKDANGDGTIDNVSSDAITLSANGSRSETLSSRSGDGTLLNQTITTTSADGKSIVKQSSDFGANGFRTSDTITIGADGARTETANIYGPDGTTLRSSTTTVSSANSLTTTSQTDLNGDGIVDQSTSSVTSLNADGSRTVTFSEFKADGSLKDKVVTTTSANGLSVTTQMNATGSGALYSRTNFDIRTLNADGSTTEVNSNWNADGTLHDNTTINIGADQKTSTVGKDINGDGLWDQSIATVVQADGTIVTYAADLQADQFTPKDLKVTTTSANGLTSTDSVYVNSADAVRQSEIYRLYEAILGRAPDASGLQSNIAALAAGATPAAIAAALINSDEFRQKYGSPSDSQFVTLLYQNALGRSPDPGGLASWSGSLQGGGLDARAAVAVGIADSTEGRQHTATLELTWAATKVSMTNATSDVKGHFVIVNADGSTIESLTDSQDSTTYIATSADGMTISKAYVAANGSPGFDSQFKQVIANADGSKTTSAWTTSTAGATEAKTTITVSADGLIKHSVQDTDMQATAAAAVQPTHFESDDVTVLNADGSSTRTITNTKSGALISKSVTTTSADGLTVTTQHDTSGSGSFDQTQISSKQNVSDGSSLVTVSKLNATGVLTEKTITTTSADGRVVSITRDADGNGTTDQVETTTKLVDGSSTDVVVDNNASGAKIDQIASTTSFDGRTTTTNWDYNADGIVDRTRSVTRSLNADGSTSTSTQDSMVSQVGYAGTFTALPPVLLKSSTSAVSADGRKTTTTTDVNGDGTTDQTVTSTTAVDGSITTTVTNSDTVRAMATSAGAVAWISALTSTNNTVPALSITTISADGLTKTVKADYVGNGSYQHAEDWRKQIDGSWSGVITETNASGTVVAKGTETISADGRTTTLKEDSHNTGHVDHIDTSIVGIDGSITQTTSDLNADGSVWSNSVTTIEAAGNRQHIARSDGSYTDIIGNGGVGLDGSSPAQGQVSSRRDYDEQGHLKRARDDFADGTAIEEQYDTTNSNTWSTVKVWLNAQSQQTRQEVVNHDGTRIVSTLQIVRKPPFDDLTTTLWRQQSYDAQGRLVVDRITYPDKTYTEQVFDAANTKSWSSIFTWYNAQGQATQQQVTNDDGSSATSYPSGQAPDVVIASDGTRLVVYTVGQPTTTGPGGTTVTSTQQYFDPQGRPVGQRDDYSDGSRREQHFDPANAQTWSSITNWFDANNQLVHEQVINRDGTRVEVFPQGQFRTTGAGDPLATFTQQVYDAQGRLLQERDDIGLVGHVEVAYNYSSTAYIKKEVTYFLPNGTAQYRITWDRGAIQRVDAFDSSYYSAPIKDPYPLFNTAAPVVLDLANKGAKDMLSPLSSSSSTYDMAGDGQQHRTAWASAGEGVLAIDADGSGQIDQRKEVVFTDWASDATSDMQALKEVFDTNHDGKLDAGDARWKDFRMLVDGKTETLDQLGIASIDLNPQGDTTWFSDGSSINGTSIFTRTDGSTGLAGDASFRYDTSAASTNGISDAGAVQSHATTQLNQLVGAMASFAPPASAQTALAAANAAQLRATPLLAAAH
jgi:YD repeat-containing protein